MIVDVHAHALSQKFLTDLVKQPTVGLSCERNAAGEFMIRRAGDSAGKSLDKHLHDMEYRLASLKRRGVTKQLFGPPPGLIAWPGHAAGTELVRAIHLQQALVAAESQGILEPMGTLALGEPDKACDELKRSIDEYGFRVAMLPTTAGGRPLDDPAYSPLFKLIEERGIALFMHPTAGEPQGHFGVYGMQVLVDFPGETTLAVARLIFAGVFKRHPSLKLILAHGGGNLVFQQGRLDSAFHASGWEADPYFTNNIDKPPSEYLKGLYYDTCTLSTNSTRFLIDTMGADRILFGTDYPYDIGDPEGRFSVPVLDSLQQEARKKIYQTNALTLLAQG